MKLRTALLALASVLALPALAQSTVALYGVADLGINRTSNRDGQRVSELRNGNNLTSRFGFRGREDLGGGLAAIFNLESGILMDTGASSSATQFFNRQAWVGLDSPLGRVTAGHQLPIISDVIAATSNAAVFNSQAASVDGSTTVAGTSLFRFNNHIGGIRLSNMVKVRSASFGGVQFLGMMTAGEGSTTVGRSESVGVLYSVPAFEVGGVVQTNRCPGGACAVSRAKDEITGLVAAYKFAGRGRVGVVVTRQRNAKYVLNANADTMSLLASFPMDPWTFSVGYQTLNDKTSLNQDVQQMNAHVKYLLSKRTELYLQYSAQSVDNNGRAVMYSAASSNSKQNQTNLGLRHSF